MCVFICIKGHDLFSVFNLYFVLKSFKCGKGDV